MSITNNKKEIQRGILKKPFVVLCVSLLLTAGATYIFYSNTFSKDQARFQSETESVKQQLEVLINSYNATIRAGQSFVESTNDLDREKFSRFVKNLELGNSYKSFIGLGLTKRNAPQLFSNSSRLPAFSELNALNNQSAIFFEPFDKANQEDVNLDVSTEPIRLEAMKRSFESGEPSATGKVTLINNATSQSKPGFLIYLPVFKAGESPPNSADKSFLIEGFVYGIIQTEDFLSEVQDSISIEDIAFKIYENEISPPNLIAQTKVDNLSAKPEFKSIKELEIDGRKWFIEAQTLPNFTLQSNSGWTILICISGLIFSLLLFGMTYLETFARTKAENIASELRESERENAFLLESEQTERKRAEDANNAKDEFISVVSHELRTPLNAIAGWSKILHTENLSASTKKQALEKIEKNLRAQTKIVEQLLDFSQMASNKSNPVNQEVNFSQVFDEAVDRSQSFADEKNISLLKKNELGDQCVVGDKDRLLKMIKNLLSNAIKFTPQGGNIFANLKIKDEKIEMTIIDTGLGISLENLPHIFEHFKQADSSITRQHGGLGLGLAISRQIIKLHGGTIKVKSDGEGKGTIFTVRLPYEKE